MCPAWPTWGDPAATGVRRCDGGRHGTREHQGGSGCVRSIGRGDIPALLGYLADDIQWKPVIGTAKHVPFSGARTGKQAVAEFFKLVAETEDFEQFEPREFVAQRGHRRRDWPLSGGEQGNRQALRLRLRDGVHAAERQGRQLP